MSGKIKNILSENSDKAPDARLLAPLLDPKTMQTFFAWYFSNLRNDALAIIAPEKTDIPSPNGPFRNVVLVEKRSFYDERPHNKHALEAAEYRQAYKFLKNNAPDMITAISLIENAISTYLETLKYKSAKATFYPNNVPTLRLRSAVTDALEKLEAGLSSKGMLQEFLPTMTYHAKGLENDFPCPRDLSRGLRACFTPISVFDSVKMEDNGTPQGYKRHQTCPFKGTIGHLMNTTFEKTEDGAYFVSERPEHGGLMMFTIRYLNGGQIPKRQHNEQIISL